MFLPAMSRPAMFLPAMYGPAMFLPAMSRPAMFLPACPGPLCHGLLFSVCYATRKTAIDFENGIIRLLKGRRADKKGKR